MPYQDFQDNWKAFTDLIEKLNQSNSTHDTLIKQYIEQNLIILNEIFSTSIKHLEQLQHAKSANDIVCTQARLTSEMTRKLTQSTQQFLNHSLGQIADYNDWLKAHCDLATD
jgi:hypothetical protein